MKIKQSKKETKLLEDLKDFKPRKVNWRVKQIRKCTMELCRDYFPTAPGMRNIISMGLRMVYDQGYIEGYKKALKKD